MKNIVHFSISLSLVGLLCCLGQGKENVQLILGSEEIETTTNVAVVDDSVSLSDYRMLLLFLLDKTIDTIANMFLTNVTFGTPNTVKRIARNVDTATDGPALTLAQANITKLSENITNLTSTSTESISFSNLTENQTKSSHINSSIVVNSTSYHSTSSAETTHLSETTFLAIKPSMHIDAKQNNNTHVMKKITNILNRFSTWSTTTIEKHIDMVSVFVLFVLLCLVGGITLFVVNLMYPLPSSRIELNQLQEIV